MLEIKLFVLRVILFRDIMCERVFVRQGALLVCERYWSRRYSSCRHGKCFPTIVDWPSTWIKRDCLSESSAFIFPAARKHSRNAKGVQKEDGEFAKCQYYYIYTYDVQLTASGLHLHINVREEWHRTTLIISLEVREIRTDLLWGLKWTINHLFRAK